MWVFRQNRDLPENGGVFVTRARSLDSVAPKSVVNGGDLNKLNPAVHGVPPVGGDMVGSGGPGRGPGDNLVNVNVGVVRGHYKGLIGIIKDTTGTIARVEMHSSNQVKSIQKEHLRAKE